MLVRPRNFSRRSTVPWARGQADWALLLDVATHLPRQRRTTLWQSIARLVAEGVVCVWGPGEAQPPRHPLEELGFVRDQDTEQWLRPFATRGRHRTQLRVLRRREGFALRAALPCSLTLQSEWSHV